MKIEKIRVIRSHLHLRVICLANHASVRGIRVERMYGREEFIRVSYKKFSETTFQAVRLV